MKKKNILPISLLLLSMISLAGCSGDKKPDSGNTGTEPSTPVTPTPGTGDDEGEKTDKAADKYKITFDYNYDGAPAANVVEVVQGGIVSEPVTPTRTGYAFTNWYLDSACSDDKVYDFTSIVSADFTLYAGWTAYDASKMITVTYNLNYEGAPNNGVYKSVAMRKNRKATKPSSPTRDNYYFDSWCADAACTTTFDFDDILTEDVTVYANWMNQYVFEAEDVDFTGKAGSGYSGNCEEQQMISPDANGAAGASNGYYVSWLYYKGANLEFKIESTADVSDVILVGRFSVEYYDMVMTADDYQVLINDEAVTGYTLTLSGAYTVGTAGMRPFGDYLLSTAVSLKKGTNTVILKTNNSVNHGGTMKANAPVVDCIKFATSDATLSWSAGYPIKGNY